MEKNTVKAKQWLDKRYRDSTPGKSTIINQYAQFKRGRTNTDDAERSGRPKSAVVPDNIAKVHKIVLGDRLLKLHEIANTLNILEGSVFTISRESLGMRKLFLKWVPRLLTPDHKQQRFEDSNSCLELFKRGKKDFLRRYVTVDETWIQHYTTATKRLAAEWTAAGESRPKLPKTQQWAGKVMASVFQDVHGILFTHYHKKDETINSGYYMVSLDRLSV